MIPAFSLHKNQHRTIIQGGGSIHQHRAFTIPASEHEKKTENQRRHKNTGQPLQKNKIKLYTAFDSSAQSFPPKQRPLSLNLSNSNHSPITLTVSLKTKTQTLHHCHQAPPSQFKPNPLRRRLALHQTSDCLFLVSATTVFAHHTAII
jgi:SLT domain-containing protein